MRTLPIKNKYTTGNHFQFDHFHFQLLSHSVSWLEEHGVFELDFNLPIDKEGAIGLSLIPDPLLVQDGFRIDTRKGVVDLYYSTPRSLYYAFDTLMHCFKEEGTSFQIPSMIIEDEPSMATRGIIEGYYGTPWTMEERLTLPSFMTKYRLNAYMYGPKSDPYHRIQWRDPYPLDIFESLSAFFQSLMKHDITPWFCLSPSYSHKGSIPILYSSEADFELLMKKYDAFYDRGIRHFGLFYDDIDALLSPKDTQVFHRVGIAHADLANRVYHQLRARGDEIELVMCPTEYHELADSIYRQDLRSHLHPDIHVYFTGDNVCAEAITAHDLHRANQQFGRKVMIWDNFPVSDFTYGVREFPTVIENRYTKMGELTTGYFINPSIHFEISKIGMISMALYAWNSEGYDSKQAYALCFDEVDERLLALGGAFFEHNRQSILSDEALIQEQKRFEKLEKQPILAYYDALENACQNLLLIQSPFLFECAPWLKRALKEVTIVRAYFDSSLTREQVLQFLEDIHFSGSRLIDRIIHETKLLTESELEQLITNRRGRQWYRVFEAKRWLK